MRPRTRPLALAVIVLMTMACLDTRRPTEPLAAPADPSAVISDGAHCANTGPIVCNPDFFFLPPMVSDPSSNANYEAGQFNPTLGPALIVEICELQTSPVDANGQLVVTDCVAGPPKKKFPAGTITLQNPPDGFYQAVWHVGESNLDVSKFYRIKVLAEGSSRPFGVADVDPVANMKELRNARTGETIPLNENSTLPIKFRIEHVGGGALCGTAALCVSTIVTNNSPTGTQSVRLEGGAGSIAGARFPNGWLPAGAPQSVVVTIAQVTTVGGGSTTDASPCHDGLVLQQFRGCFSFTTTPSVGQFAQPVLVAVCYELDGSGDPREKFAELWSSGPNEDTHPLDDASDAGLLGAASRNCNQTPIILRNNSNPVVQFASAGWRAVQRGFSNVFGVKTAYGVDLGLGGIATAFSRIGPALSANILTYSSATVSCMAPCAPVTATVRMVGSDHHGTHALTGLGGLGVKFTVAAANGSLLPVDGEGTGSSLVTATTSANPIEGDGGLASAKWTLPTAPGTYYLTASGPALNGSVTFTANVQSPGVSLDGIIGDAEWADATVYGPYTINLPDGAQTTATVYLKNTATQLFGAVKFGQDLSNQDDVILALMMDLNANAVWDNNEDGFVVHQRIGGASRNNFFDEYALCDGNVCNEASDTPSGTNDGSTASTDGGPPTSVEFVKGINTPNDALDAQLVAGQTLRFFFFTNIGTGPDARAQTWYPSQTTTASYTVR